MKVKPNLFRLYNAASAYGCRPSDFMQLETELAAWQLDEACLIVGRQVENNLSNGKPPFDGMGVPTTLNAKGYRSAKSLVKKKVKIKPDGTW